METLSGIGTFSGRWKHLGAGILAKGLTLSGKGKFQECTL
jgi:hypothetical protein